MFSRMRYGVVVLLFFVGLASVLTLALYIWSALAVLFDANVYPGLIAGLPEWAIVCAVILCTLVLLDDRKEVQDFFDRFGDKIFR